MTITVFLKSPSAGSRLQPIEFSANQNRSWPYALLILILLTQNHVRTDSMAFEIDSEVHGCHVFKDTMLSKIFHHEDRYAITHARFDTLKYLRDTVNFCCGN